jgi:hypothetical protein
MRANLLKFVLAAAFAVGFAFGLSACSGGTETGNPGMRTNTETSGSTPAPVATGQPTEGGTPGPYASERILAAICDKLNACYPPDASVSTCTTSVRAASGLGPYLGLSAYAGDYSGIISAERNGTLTPSTSAASQCVTDIATLDCASAGIRNAYSSSDPNNFSNVSNLIPNSGTSCRGVFQ